MRCASTQRAIGSSQVSSTCDSAIAAAKANVRNTANTAISSRGWARSADDGVAGRSAWM